MRLTGQATTALGNLITNLQTHCQFVVRNQAMIEAMIFLGDDMIGFMKAKPNVEKLKKEIATQFNILSKSTYNEDYGTYC